jgi:hypothetical protein
VLSSGEMTVDAKITQVRGARAYKGVALRLLTVDAELARPIHDARRRWPTCKTQSPRGNRISPAEGRDLSSREMQNVAKGVVRSGASL